MTKREQIWVVVWRLVGHDVEPEKKWRVSGLAHVDTEETILRHARNTYPGVDVVRAYKEEEEQQ